MTWHNVTNKFAILRLTIIVLLLSIHCVSKNVTLFYFFYNFGRCLSLFSDINVSQGSVATLVRCGGIFNANFIANFLMSQSVKELWKSADIWRSYHKSKKGDVFWNTVYLPPRFYYSLVLSLMLWSRYFMHVHVFVVAMVDCVVCAIVAFTNVFSIYLFSCKAASIFLINLLTWL